MRGSTSSFRVQVIRKQRVSGPLVVEGMMVAALSRRYHLKFRFPVLALICDRAPPHFVLQKVYHAGKRQRKVCYRSLRFQENTRFSERILGFPRRRCLRRASEKSAAAAFSPVSALLSPTIT